jgi:Cu/Ag efflux pump CusA
LPVGVLVDEAAVEIENIHSLLDSARQSGMSRVQAVVDACSKTALLRLLAMLCVLSVFVPSFFMVGVGRQLFVPLSLAVGFAMISSYVLSTTVVPVLATWVMRQADKEVKVRRILALARVYRRDLPQTRRTSGTAKESRRGTSWPAEEYAAGIHDGPRAEKAGKAKRPLLECRLTAWRHW